MEAQLDADIVPADALPDAGVDGSTLTLGGETYDALVVPGSTYLPALVARELLRLDDAGVPVVFVGSVPEVAPIGDDASGADANALKVRFRQVSPRRLVDAVSGMTDRAVRLDRPVESLRVLRRDLGDADVVMLVNESVRETVSATVILPRSGEVVAFDAVTGTLTEVSGASGGWSTSVHLDLGPGESTVLLVGAPSAWDGLPVRPAAERRDAVELAPTWAVGTASAGESTFEQWGELDGLRPLSDPDLLPRFSGTARYTASFDSDSAAGEHVVDLGLVFELASVRLNGVDLGTRVAPPYVFDVPAGVLAGSNTLEIDVTNTLAKAQPDFFSAFAQQEPSGLLGPVTLAPRTRKDSA
jgi:hypothetical protein